MQLLWRTLLAILFPAPSLARWTQRVLTWLQRIDGLLSDPDSIADLQTREGRLTLESQLALGEDWINFLINARAAEHLGHRQTYHERQGRFWAPAAPSSWANLMQRYQRLCANLGKIERLALRRANRIRREIETSPLRLDASHRSTSPALRAEEESNLRLFAVQISSSAKRGRWIARPCAQDGGGSRACARGPPLSSISKIQPTALLTRISENARARPIGNIMKSRSIPPAAVAALLKQA